MSGLRNISNVIQNACLAIGSLFLILFAVAVFVGPHATPWMALANQTAAQLSFISCIFFTATGMFIRFATRVI